MNTGFVNDKQRPDWRNSLAVLGGGDREILADCPQDRSAASRAGVVICSVALMACTSMAFTLRMAFHLSLVGAVLGGVAWGTLVIGPLDAYLVSVLHRQRRPVLTLALAAPRAVLAFLLAFTIGVPLTLQLFAPEINAQVKTDQENAITAYEAKLARDPRYAQIPTLQNQVGGLEKVLQSDSIPDPSADPTVVADQARVDSLQDAYDKAEQTVGCEIDGTCGTGKAGDGPAATADQAIATQDDSELLQAESSLQKAKEAASAAASSSLTAKRSDAATQLPGLKSTLADLEAQKKADLNQEKNLVAESTGMASRLEALWDLSMRYPEVAVLHIAIVLTLIAIECTPTITKTLTLMGRELLPEKLTQIRDDDLVERRRAEAQRRRRLEEETFEVERQVALEAHETACREIYGIWLERVVTDARTDPQRYLALDN